MSRQFWGTVTVGDMQKNKEEFVYKEGVMGVESWLAMPDIGNRFKVQYSRMRQRLLFGTTRFTKH